MNRVLALVLDFVLIVVFAVIGRASHAEGLSWPGIWHTGWPFGAGVLVGWVVSRGWRNPLHWVIAVTIWFCTVAGGMVLRLLTHDSAQLAFIGVATVVLAIFLLGWRGLARLLIRRRQLSRG